MNEKHQYICMKQIMHLRPMMHFHHGFTLAEVLITLVIIGVIAAMTVPSLMNNTNSQEYRVGVKKAISTLNQAITMQYALDGTKVTDILPFTAAGVRDNLFMKRLSIINTSNTAVAVLGGSTAIFYTADGMRFGITAASDAGTCDVNGTSDCFDIYIDVNGDKKPNTATASSTKPLDIYKANIYAQRVVPGSAVTQEVMYDK